MKCYTIIFLRTLVYIHNQQINIHNKLQMLNLNLLFRLEKYCSGDILKK